MVGNQLEEFSKAATVALWERNRQQWMANPKRMVGPPVQLLQAIGSQAGGCFWLMDRSINEIVYTSPAMREVFGVVPAPLPQAYDQLIQLRHPDDQREHFRFIELMYQEVLNNVSAEELLGTCFTSVLRMQAHGEYRWFAHREVPLECDRNFPVISMIHVAPVPEPQPAAWQGSLTVLGREQLRGSAALPMQSQPSREAPINLLSRQEQRILDLLAQGYSSKMIAAKLDLSVLTVATHRRNMLSKTGCANTAELVVRLARPAANAPVAVTNG